jgi:hypothetical protein
LNPDFNELLSIFNAHRVEYLIVGAHALAVYGHVRATKDLDVWVRPDPENATRILDALGEFGAPMLDLTLEDLAKPGLTYQIGVPPVRIDILTTIDGVEFHDAWRNRHEANLDELTVWVLSRRDLLANKRAAGRMQDLADVERLEELYPDG